MSTEAIAKYVHEKEDKVEKKKGRKQVLTTYKDDIGALSCAELRRLLKGFSVKMPRDQNLKVDLLRLLKRELQLRDITRGDFMNAYL